MTLPRSIRGLLSATLVSGTLAMTSLPGLAQTSASTASRFFCGLYQGHPATVVRTISRGNIPLIVWVDDSFPEPWNPQSRCEEISARFQRFYENGTLSHLRSAITNGQPALCVAAYQGGECLPNGLLLTLRPYTNPSDVLDRLLNKRIMVDGQPIVLEQVPEADGGRMKISPVGETFNGDLSSVVEINQSTIEANQLSFSQISNIAEKTTGQIFLVRENRREKAGSGVIVGRDRSHYYLLTSRHVMNYAGDYEIKMSDRQFYRLSTVGSREVSDLGLTISPELDVTILKFQSQRSYPSAQLDNKAQFAYGQEIYVFGYPSIISAPTHFSLGRITSLAPNDAKGYDFAYDNRVVPGTLGGPVLSQSGQVIGINGKAETDPATGTLIAFGIPLSRFVTDRFIDRFSSPGSISPI